MALSGSSPTAVLDAGYGQGSPQTFGSSKSWIPTDSWRLGDGKLPSFPAEPNSASWAPGVTVNSFNTLPPADTRVLDQTVDRASGVPLSMSMSMSRSPFSIGGGSGLMRMPSGPSPPGPQINSLPGPPAPPMSSYTIMPTYAGMASAYPASAAAPPVTQASIPLPTSQSIDVAPSPAPPQGTAEIAYGTRTLPPQSGVYADATSGPQNFAIYTAAPSNMRMTSAPPDPRMISAPPDPLITSAPVEAVDASFFPAPAVDASFMPAPAVDASFLPVPADSFFAEDALPVAEAAPREAAPHVQASFYPAPAGSFYDNETGSREAEQGDLVDFLAYHAQQEPLNDGGIKEDFGITSHFVRDAAVQFVNGIAAGIAAVEFHDEEEHETAQLPYGMTPEKHEEYKVQMEVFKKAEKPHHEKKELHHVENVHNNVEHAKAGHLEKNLLYLREDQLEKRFNMLEQIAAAAPDRKKEVKTQVPGNPQGLGTRSPFMDKFLPVPLGGGHNWHYFNHFEGYYIDKTKIAQREAQLRHLQEQHHHPNIYKMAGIKPEEIPEDYWERDYQSWLKKQQSQMQELMNSQAGGQAFGSSMMPPGPSMPPGAPPMPPTSSINAPPGSSMPRSGPQPGLVDRAAVSSVRNPTSALVMPSGGIGSGASMVPSTMNPFASGMIPSTGMNGPPTIPGSAMMPMNGPPTSGMMQNPFGSSMMPSTPFGSGMMPSAQMSRMY